MGFSTNEVTGVKHPAGLDMQKLAELKRRSKALRHSTGEQTVLEHATGKEFDYKVLSKRLEESVEQKDKQRESLKECKV